ncbi:type III-B CRISPR-associated protein Cas10/Cmr2 [Longirhabdus pacifica]|uniref:type III-B CRISPR-associated protein Cas10/Cmr2 n=1 Tax=Longirhabdus pacifica TaxID=2305227 RepID=UPI001008FC45|nr:type III-B CRISPR-associated protein Cas10/Cmr2 [Longirhabdus pacifica]
MEQEQSMVAITIGPAQAFISSARKMEDLWSGSYILSYLSELGLQHIFDMCIAESLTIRSIYPNYLDAQSLEARPNKEVPSMPNRLMFLLNDNPQQAARIAERIAKTIENELVKMYSQSFTDIFGDVKDSQTYMYEFGEQQVANALEIYWAVEPTTCDDKQFERSKKKLEQKLIAMKHQRKFRNENQQGIVCTVCGEREALHQEQILNSHRLFEMKKQLQQTWKKRNKDKGYDKRIQDREYLCGVCSTRRAFRAVLSNRGRSVKHFDSVLTFAEENNYYGLVLMDGDNMGQWFKGEHRNDGQSLLTYNQQLSRKLVDFSTQALDTVTSEDHKGRLIYAGGDDVFAIAPLHTILPMAHQLQKDFYNVLEQLKSDQEPTSSAGIMIVHGKTPLNIVLNHTRRLEKKAKAHGPDKNAFALSIYTGSGEIREVSLRWEAMESVQQLVNSLKKDTSANFIYTFTETILPLLGSHLNNLTDKEEQAQKDELKEIIQIELSRMMHRSGKNYVEDDMTTELLIQSVMACYHCAPTVFQFIHLLQIARFMKVNMTRVKQQSDANAQS